jgi:hypothetical protein
MFGPYGAAGYDPEMLDNLFARNRFNVCKDHKTPPFIVMGFEY